ncbi:hypothetical protein DXA09_09140 [Absiella sp. AM54-8XD]|nr:hypothetical protein DXA09_09140 [Absiella sp. AM54-8XD]RHU07224.1 hypothetical protein DW716_09510 [Absiella sp. AM27-20]
MTCPKTTILGAALPHSRRQRPGGTGGQPVLWRIVAVGWPGPPAAQVLVARSLVEKSPRTRRLAPRAMLGAAAVLLWRGRQPTSHIPPEKQGVMEMLFRNFPANIFSCV